MKTYVDLHVHDDGDDLRVADVIKHDVGRISLRVGTVRIYATPAAFAQLAADLTRIAADYHQRTVTP